MALNRFSTNIIFACVVFVLALTAATSFYRNSSWQGGAVEGMETPAGNSMPENHPPIDAEQRLEALKQLSDRDPDNPDYQIQIANLYYDTGQYDRAVGYYERSLKLRPEDPNVETDLAVCLHYTGQHDRALETLERVLSYRPGFAQAMFNKGVILLNGKNDAKGARFVWEELLRLNPNYPNRAEVEQRISRLGRLAP